MTLVEVLREEGFEKGIRKGFEKGIEKGIEEGIEKGKSELAVGLAVNRLIKKFGIMPAAYREKIIQLDLNSLEILNYEIDNFTSIEDVKKFLAL